MHEVNIDVTGASTAALMLAAHTLQALVHKGLLQPAEQTQIMNNVYNQLASEGKAALKTVYPGFTFS